MNNSGGAGYLIVMLVVVAVVVAVVGTIIAIGPILMGAVAAAGLISGVFVGIKNFFEVLDEAHNVL